MIKSILLSLLFVASSSANTNILSTEHDLLICNEDSKGHIYKEFERIYFCHQDNNGVYLWSLFNDKIEELEPSSGLHPTCPDCRELILPSVLFTLAVYSFVILCLFFLVKQFGRKKE